MKTFLISFVLMCGLMLASCGNVAKHLDPAAAVEDTLSMEDTTLVVDDTLSVDTVVVDSVL